MNAWPKGPLPFLWLITIILANNVLQVDQHVDVAGAEEGAEEVAVRFVWIYFNLLIATSRLV
jgi:hypothetical protein